MVDCGVIGEATFGLVTTMSGGVNVGGTAVLAKGGIVLDLIQNAFVPPRLLRIQAL